VVHLYVLTDCIPNISISYPEDGHDSNWNMLVVNIMW